MACRTHADTRTHALADSSPEQAQYALPRIHTLPRACARAHALGTCYGLLRFQQRPALHWSRKKTKPQSQRRRFIAQQPHAAVNTNRVVRPSYLEFPKSGSIQILRPAKPRREIAPELKAEAKNHSANAHTHTHTHTHARARALRPSTRYPPICTHTHTLTRTHTHTRARTSLTRPPGISAVPLPRLLL